MLRDIGLARFDQVLYPADTFFPFDKLLDDHEAGRVAERLEGFKMAFVLCFQSFFLFFIGIIIIFEYYYIKK